MHLVSFQSKVLKEVHLTSVYLTCDPGCLEYTAYTRHIQLPKLMSAYTLGVWSVAFSFGHL